MMTVDARGKMPTSSCASISQVAQQVVAAQVVQQAGVGNGGLVMSVVGVPPGAAPQSSPDSRSESSEASEDTGAGSGGQPGAGGLPLPGAAFLLSAPLGPEDICRDFLRNVCKRGRRCKYRHPPAGEARELGKRHEFTFCHDFQNSGCRRANCRFIHCTREEEDYYKQTGQLPVRLQQAAALGIGVLPNEMPLMKGEVPICKDHLKGECKRGNRCKYRHVPSTTDFQPPTATAAVYDPARTPTAVVTDPTYVTPTPAPAATPTVTNGIYAATSYAEDFNGFDYEALAPKRRKLDPTAAAAPPPTTLPPPPFNLSQPPPPLPQDNTAAQTHFAVTETNNNHFAAAVANAQPAPGNGATLVPVAPVQPAAAHTYRILRTPSDFRLLEEENVMLRRKVEELKKQVSDLAATNEVLLEQNARYRSSKVESNAMMAQGPPIVTVSQVVTPTITPAPAAARSLHTPTAQIGASLTTLRHITLEANSANMIVSQALQSARLPNDLNQSASIAAAAAGLNMVPVTENLAVAPRGPVPVSLGGPSPQIAVSMAGPQIAVSLPQTSLPPPTLGGSAGPTSHLVSYPIMSHSITQLPSASITQLPNTSLG